MNNQHWHILTAYDRITEARTAAAHDRLVLAAENARHKPRQSGWWPLALLFRALTGTFGRRRPLLEPAHPAGQVR